MLLLQKPVRVYLLNFIIITPKLRLCIVCECGWWYIHISSTYIITFYTTKPNTLPQMHIFHTYINSTKHFRWFVILRICMYRWLFCCFCKRKRNITWANVRVRRVLYESGWINGKFESIFYYMKHTDQLNLTLHPMPICVLCAAACRYFIIKFSIILFHEHAYFTTAIYAAKGSTGKLCSTQKCM